MRTNLRYFWIIAIVASLFGCSTTDRTEECAKYRQIYDLYQLSLLGNRVPSEKEKEAAMAAALFLTTYCGWNSSTSDRGLNVDVNGVPIIYPTK